MSDKPEIKAIDAVEILVKAAAAQPDGGEAMRYSQAACNVANALITVENIKRMPPAPMLEST